jgi:hypothetical protein
VRLQSDSEKKGGERWERREERARDCRGGGGKYRK